MTLRVPSAEIVSTMTLRLGSSWRTRKMPAPPMPSRRFSTTFLCSSMNPWRKAISRATSEGTVNSANSAIANFSLWSRSARGALNTEAPCRSASDRSHVLATYSMSNGGSLRISTASNSKSGRSTVSCGRYQSSSFSARDSRTARVLTVPRLQKRSCCSHTKIVCPRAWAARIIATVVSLYALSSAGGSMMKRRTRLFALGDHEFDARAHLGVGQRRVARARGHGALALDDRLDKRVHSLLDARRPCGLVAQAGRSGDRLGVAGDAHLVVHGLAAGRGGLCVRSRLCIGRGLHRSGRRLRLLLYRLRSFGLRGLLWRGRLLEFAARLVRHVHHRARDLLVGERRIPALRRHGALALDHGGHHSLEALLDVRRPSLGIADPRRIRHAGLVAGCAGRLHDGFTRARTGRSSRRAELDAADGLDARGNRLGLQCVRIGGRAVHDELYQHDDRRDGNQERQQDDDDQLLRRLDERRVRVVLGHEG